MNFAIGIWAAAIAWSDWRYLKVPNVLLVLLLVPAVLALAVNRHGLLGVAVWPSLAGLLIAVVLLPGYALGYMGAGDVKFAGCLGLLLGPWATVKMLLVFAIALGLTAAALLWIHRASAGSRQRRIAAAPALVLGFAVQLLFPQWLPWHGWVWSG
ncbi:MAG: prepilin peptidase [Stenotrophobium sp.]